MLPSSTFRSAPAMHPISPKRRCPKIRFKKQIQNKRVICPPETLVLPSVAYNRLLLLHGAKTRDNVASKRPIISGDIVSGYVRAAGLSPGGHARPLPTSSIVIIRVL